MDIALITTLSILLALGLGAIAIVYSYGVYIQSRIFTKPKFPLVPIICCGLLLICLIVFFAIICVNYNGDKRTGYYPAYLGLSTVLIILDVVHITWLTTIYIINQNDKINYLEIPNIDWKKKEADLTALVGDLEALKDKMSKSNPSYYTQMLQYYKGIVLKLSAENIPYSENVADIVTFNELFTHKWSAKMNNLQLMLTYRFCSLLEKNPCQK